MSADMYWTGCTLTVMNGIQLILLMIKPWDWLLLRHMALQLYRPTCTDILVSVDQIKANEWGV